MALVSVGDVAGDGGVGGTFSFEDRDQHVAGGDVEEDSADVACDSDGVGQVTAPATAEPQEDIWNQPVSEGEAALSSAGAAVAAVEVIYFCTREGTSALHEIRTRRRQGNDGSAFTNLTPVNQWSQVLGSQTSFNFSTGAVSVMAARSTVPGMKLEHEEEDSYFPLSLCLLFAASILVLFSLDIFRETGWAVCKDQISGEIRFGGAMQLELLYLADQRVCDKPIASADGLLSIMEEIAGHGEKALACIRSQLVDSARVHQNAQAVSARSSSGAAASTAPKTTMLVEAALERRLVQRISICV